MNQSVARTSSRSQIGRDHGAHNHARKENIMDIVELDRKNVEMVKAVAKLYATVFNEPPWNETWSQVDAVAAVHNSVLSWWVAIEGDAIIGFTAGTVASPDVIAREFKVPSELMTGTRVGYKAEVGVDPNQRRRGLARTLTQKLLEHFKANQVDQFLVRTRPHTGNYPWYCQTLSRLYHYSDGRVIFGCPGVPTL